MSGAGPSLTSQKLLCVSVSPVSLSCSSPFSSFCEDQEEQQERRNSCSCYSFALFIERMELHLLFWRNSTSPLILDSAARRVFHSLSSLFLLSVRLTDCFPAFLMFFPLFFFLLCECYMIHSGVRRESSNRSEADSRPHSHPGHEYFVLSH